MYESFVMRVCTMAISRTDRRCVTCSFTLAFHNCEFKTQNEIYSLITVVVYFKSYPDNSLVGIPNKINLEEA